MWRRGGFFLGARKHFVPQDIFRQPQQNSERHLQSKTNGQPRIETTKDQSAMCMPDTKGKVLSADEFEPQNSFIGGDDFKTCESYIS